MFVPDDTYRFIPIPRMPAGASTDYRSDYDRDYARVLHSPSFRRLQNKTQLFPGQESDFFRNRLTHSLEVSQIAASIANKLKSENKNLPVLPEVCEIAGLIHDIGHPPFGHNGESALDECMLNRGGFEGNAQTIRVITRLEKRESPGSTIIQDNQDCRVGLNLTARVIASCLKYDKMIPPVRQPNSKLVKGYYASEAEIIAKVKSCLVENPLRLNKPFKTIECSIMDIADDIAYSTYDVEDALKAEFLTPLDIIAADPSIFNEICKKLKEKDGIDITTEECQKTLYSVFEEMWSTPIKRQRELKKNSSYEQQSINNLVEVYRNSKSIAKDGFNRTALTSRMVNSFINGVHVRIDNKHPILSSIYLDPATHKQVCILKHFSYVVLVNSSRLRVAESRGREIITKMFNKLVSGGGHSLLPEDVKSLYNQSDDALWQARVICDFIAGMTDRYALEFYGRLFSENPQTIFKPL